MRPDDRGPRYNDEENTPPSLAMRIHDELTDREEERIREARNRGLQPASRPDVDARVAARDRVRQRHGPPGHGLTVPEEVLCEECSPAVLERIARDPEDGSLRIGSGGASIQGECPVCGRAENAFALVDLRDVDNPVRARIQNANLSATSPPGQMPPYTCSGCWTRWIRSGLMTKSEWMEAHGASRELVERVRGTRNDRSP